MENCEEKNNNQQKPSKSKDDSLATGISLGLCFGVVFGIIFNNLAIGISIGIALGIAIGAGNHKKGGNKKTP